MPQIISFSPETVAAMRRFFNEERPVLEMHKLRLSDESTAKVRIAEMKCDHCGWVYVPGPVVEPVPADTLRAYKITHAWDQKSRSTYCGGSMLVSLA